MENEHFLNFKKASEIKFPLKIGPFIVKNKFSLPVIEGLLQDMNFMKASKPTMILIISYHRGGNKIKTNGVSYLPDDLHQDPPDAVKLITKSVTIYLLLQPPMAQLFD